MESNVIEALKKAKERLEELGLQTQSLEARTVAPGVVEWTITGALVEKTAEQKMKGGKR